MLKIKLSIFLCFICILQSIKAHQPTNCHRSCGSHPIKDLPMPFGFSSGCQIPLTCSGDGNIFINEFQVQSFSSENILVNLPGNCSRPIDSISRLFGRNYAPTSHNEILLQNCSSPVTGCIIPTTTIQTRFELMDCESKNNSISCYSEQNKSNLFLDYSKLTWTRCESLFSAVSSESFGNSSAVSLDVQLVQLGWWLDGYCQNCSDYATCILIVSPFDGSDGYRCQCLSGFVGDGYRGSSGCRKGDCRDKCWNDCECVGYQVTGACVVWRGKESKFNQTGTSDELYALISEPTKKSSAPTDSPNTVPSAKKKMWIVIASSSSLVLLVSGSLGYLAMRKLRQKKEKRRQEENLLELATSDDFDNANETKKSRTKGHDIKIFSFGDIVAATNNFSNDNKLGGGGFGLVYKGKLSDEREIAIKRLSKTSGQGVLEFKNELILIAKLQHRNLVRVLGCCIHGDEKMLVYEYMSNKSLDSFLFDTTKKVQLDWRTRLNIIEGIAQGLLYLHKYSRMRVIHRDLKASNVLLDEHMNPKISDFGMARIFKKDETEAMTNRIVGTHGYMSPEYLMGGTFSEKSDVFSFGVLTIEIASGRRNTSFYHLDKLFNLIGFAWMLWKEGEALKLKDPTLLLDDSHVVDNLLRTIQVGLLCVQENATSRPTMSDVIAMLSKETMPLPIPQKPAFFTQQDEPEPTSNEGILTNCSSNYMSISTLEARA